MATEIMEKNMQLKSEIRHFIVENYLYGQDSNDFEDGTSFLEKGLIDSTGVLELVSFVQEKYGISVADEELIPDNFDSIQNLSAYIIKKMGDGDQG